MSDRNRDDYFDLDNFDETIDSRDYRRRQAARNNRSSSYGNRRPSSRRPSSRRPNSRRRNRTRLRNRIVILAGGAAILIFLIILISLMFRGCSKKEPVEISTDTKTQQQSGQESATEAAAQANAQTGDPLSTSFFMTPVIDDDNSAGTDFGTVYGWHGSAYELFGGSDDSAKTYADTVNSLASKLSGINVYSMIVPNHTEYGLPQRLKDGSVVQSNSQADNIKKAYESMSGVTPVNAYNYLAEHNKEYTYFHSDHHWTGLGAYYAYKAFADTLKLTPLDLKQCTEKQIDGFTGTFSDIATGLDPDSVHYWQFPYSVSMELHYASGSTENYDSPYFENATAGSNTYGVFIFGDNPLTILKSQSENVEPNRKIAVVKESYGNAFVPYLTQNFSEVHIMDLRTFRANSDVDLATYCKNNGITDFLFLNGIMSANTQGQLDNITAMFD